MKTRLLLFISFSCAVWSRAENTRNYKDDVESKLMNYLFGRYNKLIRPTQNKSHAVNMTFGIAYVQLIQLDDREQTLISNVWIRQKWWNEHLTWDPNDFNNISLLNVDPRKVWLPDIVLYNNAKSGPGAGTMYQFKTKVTLKFNGENTWYAPTIIRSGCNIDITFFPFDDQYCVLKFGSWTYNGLELDLYRDRETADLDAYLKSAEFDLISAKAIRKVFRYSCCPEPYPNIIFTIHLRRQPGFYLFNVIIPSMVITFFAILTFTSPPPIGERISLAIESFLSLSFLCMMVADSIPVNSDVSPLITKFLMTCMVMISTALVLNLVSMNLSSSKPVPKWLKTISFYYIGPCVGFFPNDDLGKSKLITKAKDKLRKARNLDCSLPTKLQDVILNKLNLTDKKYPETTHKKLMIHHTIPANMTKAEYQEHINNMNDILDRSTHEFKQMMHKDFWRCVAQTADRICMILFSLSFIFVSAVMLLKGYGHQLKVQK